MQKNLILWTIADALDLHWKQPGYLISDDTQT